MPFFKTLVIYYVAWLPVEYKSLIPALIKCLPILCLIVFVGSQGVSLREEHDYQRRIFAGLIFSCIGDALLVWEDTHFMTAIAAFAFAHISYIRAFGFSKFRWLKGIPFIGLFLLAVYIFYPKIHGLLIPFVFLYVMIICSMGWRAFAQVDILENVWTWTSLCGVIGAVLFMFSDLTIGINKFVMLVPYSRVIVMTTYYAAQVFIALSAVNTRSMMIRLRMSSKSLLSHELH